ncbi:MAG: cellulase family glycosylhydrolase, partial [Kiritimatiellaeota bacterium]|nr:cellulase family glycosylhydrolase [Kiritimatiellota bacterium]
FQTLETQPVRASNPWKIDMKKIILLVAMLVAVAQAAPLGLTVQDGVLLKDGKLYRGVGINYFDCFLRVLANGTNTSYDADFQTLAAYHIPFARFCATGFWPRDMKLYQTDRAEYFRRLDGVVKSAEKHGVGLIPSLFWHTSCVPDLVGEPVGEWANPQSKTCAWMREYVREVVTRYKDSSALWAWEFGNEYSLGACLPNAKDHRAPVHPSLGTAKSRSERDDLTYDMTRSIFAEFAKTVRAHDAHRLIVTGDSFPRLSAWHQEHEGKWTHDNKAQFQEMLRKANPDPVSGIGLHAYEDDDQRFAWALEVARELKKPIFIGEFGAQNATPAQIAKFHRLLKAITASGIPLAALWVFELKSQPDFTVVPGGARAYQLEALRDWNLAHAGK